MGYFSNGTEGCQYQADYCDHCIHNDGCPVMLAHMLHNYNECNNHDSILHLLIPRNKGGSNEQCKMFVPSAKIHKGPLPKHLREWGKRTGIIEVNDTI